MLDRAQLLRRLAAGAVAAPLAERLHAADAAAATGGGNFPAHPRWKFAFLSQLTTSPLFVSLQYGIQDACALVGCTYQWSGSARGDVSEVLRQLDAAISANVDGIAVSIVDGKSFNGPVERALRAAIPVVAFNSDAPAGSGNPRLAFTGVNPYAVGFEAGARLAKMLGGGEVALLKGSDAGVDAESRLQGAAAALKRSGAQPLTVRTGANAYEATARIDDWVADRRRLHGMLAVDAPSTEGAGAAMQKYGLARHGVRSGGFGILPAILDLVDRGALDFTIDEQPYLQGFCPVLQLFLHKLSGGLAAPADTNTGPLFVTKANVGPYLNTKTRFDGSSSRQRYPIS